MRVLGYTSEALNLSSDDDWVHPKGIAYLNHSCDEWIIGGRNEIELMIKDLQALLKRMA